MNHAYAAHACSIINVHLIRRSSSALKIFTKVWTTSESLRNEIEEAETCPRLARRTIGHLSATLLAGFLFFFVADYDRGNEEIDETTSWKDRARTCSL